MNNEPTRDIYPSPISNFLFNLYEISENILFAIGMNAGKNRRRNETKKKRKEKHGKKKGRNKTKLRPKDLHKYI